MKPNLFVAIAFAVGIITAAVAQPEDGIETYTDECPIASFATDVGTGGVYDDWCEWLYATRGKR